MEKTNKQARQLFCRSLVPSKKLHQGIYFWKMAFLQMIVQTTPIPQEISILQRNTCTPPHPLTSLKTPDDELSRDFLLALMEPPLRE
ncbi:hypothetical protein NPIL_440291 [Nephila pilipes]|uniref:Uncharacterized protein n=1 Tax=Nephila pilipes TaxID=299642 RepID=A0A8X6NGG3_NEPPI|nr:hypothetical protein NPIL_440291 [Nephila pilipes]